MRLRGSRAVTRTGRRSSRHPARRSVLKPKHLAPQVRLPYVSGLCLFQLQRLTVFCQAEKAFKSVGSLLEIIVQESQTYIQQERQLLLDAKALSDEATSAEIGRLQEQNALLTRLLESERLKSEKAKDQLILRISGLLGDFATERDRSLRDAFEEMHNRNVIGEGEMERCGSENGERIINVIRAGEDWGSSLTRRGGESKRSRDGAFKVRIVRW
jgi:kinesin family protein 11